MPALRSGESPGKFWQSPLSTAPMLLSPRAVPWGPPGSPFPEDSSPRLARELRKETERGGERGSRPQSNPRSRPQALCFCLSPASVQMEYSGSAVAGSWVELNVLCFWCLLVSLSSCLVVSCVRKVSSDRRSMCTWMIYLTVYCAKLSISRTNRSHPQTRHRFPILR